MSPRAKIAQANNKAKYKHYINYLSSMIAPPDAFPDVLLLSWLFFAASSFACKKMIDNLVNLFVVSKIYCWCRNALLKRKDVYKYESSDERNSDSSYLSLMNIEEAHS